MTTLGRLLLSNYSTAMWHDKCR